MLPEIFSSKITILFHYKWMKLIVNIIYFFILRIHYDYIEHSDWNWPLKLATTFLLGKLTKRGMPHLWWNFNVPRGESSSLGRRKNETQSNTDSYCYMDWIYNYFSKSSSHVYVCYDHAMPGTIQTGPVGPECVHFVVQVREGIQSISV